MPIISALDIVGIQRYIFASNRLRDIVAASYQVRWSTSPNGALKHCPHFPKNIILSGGGNLIVQFDTLDVAREFTAWYTRLLHDKAPGLDVAVVHKEYTKGDLAQALLNIQGEIAEKKLRRRPSAPMLGISVTESCRETGLPATHFHKTEQVPLSETIWKRREVYRTAAEEWVKLFLQRFAHYEFPDELDDLGRTIYDTSLIAVVHIDGNGVGTKISGWLKDSVKQRKDDAVLVTEYKKWSAQIDKLAESSFRYAIDKVIQAIQKSQDRATVVGQPAHLSFPLKKNVQGTVLPIRPILLGGDDMTFVCDARIAHAVTEIILGTFDKSNVPHLGKISACAGICIVRSHFPFSRAYEFAEKLCRSAKDWLRQKAAVDMCALDWHIGSPRPNENVVEMRKRNYEGNGYKFSCRPYPLKTFSGSDLSWKWLSGELLDGPDGLRKEPWSGKRNKVKALADIIRKGPEAVELALERWAVVDSRICFPKAISDNGYVCLSRTPILDALELLDIYLDLS